MNDEEIEKWQYHTINEDQVEEMAYSFPLLRNQGAIIVIQDK